ncbi:TetR/AcrR family transcriptional regulator [Brachybacterium sacelli]|uniref:AcrR family transcriptional regulator n=1 Tax=Brachybacterium sacelli TaxID=173364 RepID=A0ABS4WYM2_9MICO|nr:TetR/AcrR family transcriptional regulator [Brachybacterium sacelli]MBP2381243.1 AcrR family transcriptional regulator [Brachybacterium sacelli]
MPRPTRTTPKGAEARARVITEATRVFSRDGYRAGSLSRIAEAAGLTQQGLLHYFPNKAALLLAVVAERERSTAEHLERTSGSRSVLDRFVEAVEHNIEEPYLVELMTVLSAESTDPDHPTHAWFLQRYDDLVARLAAGVLEEQRSGRWAGGAEPEQAARTLVGLADGLRLQRLLGHPELDHAALLRTHLQAMRIGGTTP